MNRLHIDLILSVIAAARFQIQTEHLKNKKWQDILDQEQELPVSLVRQYSVRIKVLSRRTILPDNMETPEKERLLEYGIQLREKQKAKYTYGVLKTI